MTPRKQMSQGKLKLYNLVGLQPQQQMTVCCLHHLENQPQEWGLQLLLHGTKCMGQTAHQ